MVLTWDIPGEVPAVGRHRAPPIADQRKAGCREADERELRGIATATVLAESGPVPAWDANPSPSTVTTGRRIERERCTFKERPPLVETCASASHIFPVQEGFPRTRALHTQRPRE